MILAGYVVCDLHLRIGLAFGGELCDRKDTLYQVILSFLGQISIRHRHGKSHGSDSLIFFFVSRSSRDRSHLLIVRGCSGVGNNRLQVGTGLPLQFAMSVFFYRIIFLDSPFTNRPARVALLSVSQYAAPMPSAEVPFQSLGNNPHC